MSCAAAIGIWRLPFPDRRQRRLNFNRERRGYHAKTISVSTASCARACSFGCGSLAKQDKDGTAAEDTVQTTADAETVTGISDMFSNRDFEIGYDEGNSVRIELNGATATCSSNAVKISGSTVTITDEGTYVVSGSLDGGMIVVDADKEDKTQLVFDNVSINSETCAPDSLPGYIEKEYIQGSIKWWSEYYLPGIEKRKLMYISQDDIDEFVNLALTGIYAELVQLIDAV